MKKPFFTNSNAGDLIHINEFNEHHGTNFKDWTELHKSMGYSYLCGKVFLECYLNWLEVYETPLYQVMQEKDEL